MFTHKFLKKVIWYEHNTKTQKWGGSTTEIYDIIKIKYRSFPFNRTKKFVIRRSTSVNGNTTTWTTSSYAQSLIDQVHEHIINTNKEQ
jgi:hypothetical protein